MPNSISQPVNQTKRTHLKTWQWIIPLILLATLVGGYFVYQNYFLQKTTREIPASAPAANQSTEAPEAVKEDDFWKAIRDIASIVIESRDQACETSVDCAFVSTSCGDCGGDTVNLLYTEKYAQLLDNECPNPPVYACDWDYMDKFKIDCVNSLCVFVPKNGDVSKIITAQGNIQPLEGSIWQYGTHTLLDEDVDILYALSSDAVTLDDYNRKKVEVQGSLKEGYPVDGGPPYMEVDAIKEIK